MEVGGGGMLIPAAPLSSAETAIVDFTEEKNLGAFGR
jgi:hypothetical protein